jgi:hypothetical protein
MLCRFADLWPTDSWLLTRYLLLPLTPADAKRAASKHKKGRADCQSGGSTPKHSNPASTLPNNQHLAAAAQRGSSSFSSGRPASVLQQPWINAQEAARYNVQGACTQSQQRLMPLMLPSQVGRVLPAAALGPCTLRAA